MTARPLAAAVLALSLSLPVTSAMASTVEPTQPPLAEHMTEADQSWYDSLQAWMDARYQQKEEPVTAPGPEEPTESASADPTVDPTTPAAEPTESASAEPTASASPEATASADPSPSPAATEDTAVDEDPDPVDPGTVTVGDGTTDEPDDDGTGGTGTDGPPRTTPDGGGATTDPTTPAAEPTTPAAEPPAEEEHDGLFADFKGWFVGWFDDWFRENYADELNGSPAPDPTTPAADPTTPAADPSTDPVGETDLAAEVQTIVDGHNALRESRGLAPLTHSPDIAAVAQAWSEEMAANGTLAHNPEHAEQTPGGPAATGENIALITGTGTEAAQAAMEGWINSPDHEANIVGGFTHLGVGVATTDAGETYYTVNFADFPEDQENPPAVEYPVEDDQAQDQMPTVGEGTTGGTGGTATSEELEFTSSSGMTSTYRIFVPEQSTEAPGLVFWADGSGGYGYENPEDDYLIGGEDGLAAVAAARNMILVVPLAPEPGCPSSNCWYDQENAEEKAAWSSELMTLVKSQYDINLDRIAVGGYSSGAQWTTRYFIPAHGEEQSVDLGVAVAWGSPGDLSGISPDYAASTVVVFNTGTNDTNGGDYTAYDGAQAGREAYEAAGFDVDWEESTSTHDRGGDFGPILAENLDDHLS